jgi:hypothetical protein
MSFEPLGHFTCHDIRVHSCHSWLAGRQAWLKKSRLRLWNSLINGFIKRAGKAAITCS